MEIFLRTFRIACRSSVAFGANERFSKWKSWPATTSLVLWVVNLKLLKLLVDTASLQAWGETYVRRLTIEQSRHERQSAEVTEAVTAGIPKAKRRCLWRIVKQNVAHNKNQKKKLIIKKKMRSVPIVQCGREWGRWAHRPARLRGHPRGPAPHPTPCSQRCADKLDLRVDRCIPCRSTWVIGNMGSTGLKRSRTACQDPS